MMGLGVIEVDTPEPKKILLLRIIHIDNISHILQIKKLTSLNHAQKDENYVTIGDPDLIQTRNKKKIHLEPKGTFNDYVAFYFTIRSPMLYRIQKGYSVKKVEPQKIVYCVTRFEIIKDLKYIFTDGHANDNLTLPFNNAENLKEIDWEIISSKYWKDDEDDRDRKRKKQAEFLIWKELPLSKLIGFAVYNEDAKAKMENLLNQFNVNLPVKIHKEWYY